ncbi:hypothetical protein ANME2D_00274 [Candidatus Methanoperedens nitroreducens]|uniref:Uncharacterized protein n=1 Tax=Candidatus Methanoperedens nitratireducens TaxID=1392998 RepID=A0A062VBY1_9EURY|nr:hypothetical protein ANME2D_00274 [Candidatus Methanoperedens nitroreducens]
MLSGNYKPQMNADKRTESRLGRAHPRRLLRQSITYPRIASQYVCASSRGATLDTCPCVTASMTPIGGTIGYLKRGCYGLDGQPQDYATTDEHRLILIPGQQSIYKNYQTFICVHRRLSAVLYLLLFKHLTIDDFQGEQQR